MKYDYHAVVIGGGSGGLVVAAGCANFGAKTALVEPYEMGGDCLNAGCVPSKAFLKAAHSAAAARELGRLGLGAQVEGVDLGKVMRRVASVVAEVAPRDSEERFRGLGVDVFRTSCRITGRNSVETGGRTLTARYIVAATGSSPLVPAIPGLDKVAYHTNRTVFKMTTLPRRLLILGAGPVGLELGQAFRQLGSEVEIIDRADAIFPKDDPEAAPLMRGILEKEGVRLHLGAAILGVEKDGAGIAVNIKTAEGEKRLAGDALLVALGRVPNTDIEGLKEAGVKINERGYLVTDARLRTSVPNIFACGDCTGPYLFTHAAGYQAGVIIRNIALGLPAKADYYNIAWTTYTRPEVAHVGLTEQEASARGLLRDKVLVPLGENDRAMAEGDTAGFLKLNIGAGGRLLGATMVGEKAGELIGAASLAVTKRLKAGVFASPFFSYPTEAEIYKTASYEYMKRGFKPWMKKIVKSVLLRDTASGGKGNRDV